MRNSFKREGWTQKVIGFPKKNNDQIINYEEEKGSKVILFAKIKWCWISIGKGILKGTGRVEIRRGNFLKPLNRV